MDVQISHHDDITILRPLREPRAEDIGSLAKRLKNFCQRGQGKIIFAIEGLDHITSTGIGVLVKASDTVKENGGRLVLAGVQPAVERILGLMDLLEFFEIHESFAHAVAALGGGTDVVAQHQAGETQQQSPRELAERLIRHVVTSRLHVRLIQLLATKHIDVVSVKTLAKATGESEAALYKPLHDLVKAGLLKSFGQGTAYNYAPSPEQTAEINAFLRLWANSRRHGELLKAILKRERRSAP